MNIATSTATPSLGEMLRTKIDNDARAVVEKRQREAAQAQAEQDRATNLVHAFFRDAREGFERDILAGIELESIQVRKHHAGDIADVLNIYATRQVNRLGHPYHAMWEAFSNWAETNGLTAVWAYEHDGMGVESWYVLSVAPTPVP